MQCRFCRGTFDERSVFHGSRMAEDTATGRTRSAHTGSLIFLFRCLLGVLRVLLDYGHVV